MNTKKINMTTTDIFPDPTPILQEALKEARKIGLANTVQYRLFLAIKSKYALYHNPEVMAVKLSKGVQGLPDTISAEDLDSIAEELVGLFNDTYLAVLKDVNNDKYIANQVIQEMIIKQ